MQELKITPFTIIHKKVIIVKQISDFTALGSYFRLILGKK